jgi:hypothetical protein
MLALSTMVASSLLEKSHLSPILVIPIVLAMGTALGLFMGYLIQAFNCPPFIITLAGLYPARGLCYVVSIDTIAITNQFWQNTAYSRLDLIGYNSITPGAAIAIVVVLAGLYMSRFTKFGRTVYAIGGNEQSALLMGLPVAGTKIAIYALNGFCSALAGIVFTFYTLSGYALNGKGMELDAGDGKELASEVSYYRRWAAGLYCDSARNMFRQHPLDYTESLEESVRGALHKLGKNAGSRVGGIGIDTTGSTPCAVDRGGTPLALTKGFEENPNAMFVLWKDHTAVEEAELINRVARGWGGTDFTKYEGGRIPPSGSGRRSFTSCARTPRCAGAPSPGWSTATG